MKALSKLARAVSFLLFAGSGSVGRAADEAHPFPQRTAYVAGSILPNRMMIEGVEVAPTRAQLEAPVTAFYARWKAKYLKTVGELPWSDTAEAYVSFNLDRDSPNLPTVATVAEAHGYGMLLTVLMAGRDGAAGQDAVARLEFDSLFRYFENPAHKSAINPVLMASRQLGAALTTEPGDNDSATDGDLDIAYALLLAQAQWGSAADQHYLAAARVLLSAIMASEVNQTQWVPKLGDWVQEGGARAYRQGTRTSDFMGQHWGTFAALAGSSAERAQWRKLRMSGYDVLSSAYVNFAPTTGLMPDFLTYEPAAQRRLFVPVSGHYLEDAKDGSYCYNACRVPWRLATDHLVTGEARALPQLSTLNLWIQRKTGHPEVAGKLYRGAPRGDPARINAGYTLAGGPLYHGSQDAGSCFDAPLAVSAMISPANQEWLNLLWGKLMESVQPGVPSEKYYNDTVKLLCLIVLTGNWWDPAVPLGKVPIPCSRILPQLSVGRCSRCWRSA